MKGRGGAFRTRCSPTFPSRLAARQRVHRRTTMPLLHRLFSCLPRRHSAAIVAAVLCLPGAGAADVLSITRWTVDGGGSGFVDVGALVLGGTIGQPDAHVTSLRSSYGV